MDALPSSSGIARLPNFLEPFRLPTIRSAPDDLWACLDPVMVPCSPHMQVQLYGGPRFFTFSFPLICAPDVPGSCKVCNWPLRNGLSWPPPESAVRASTILVFLVCFLAAPQRFLLTLLRPKVPTFFGSTSRFSELKLLLDRYSSQVVGVSSVPCSIPQGIDTYIQQSPLTK